MAQYTRGAFSRYATPSSRAVTQSPEVSMLRAICACTASTSSISEGGERMQPRYTAPATSRIPRYKCRFFPLSRNSFGNLPPEPPIFSSTEIAPSNPIGDSQHWLVSPGDLESASRSRPAGKGPRDSPHHPTKPPASEGADIPEANHGPGCRILPSFGEEPKPAAYRASIPSVELFAANRESS